MMIGKSMPEFVYSDICCFCECIRNFLKVLMIVDESIRYMDRVPATIV